MKITLNREQEIVFLSIIYDNVDTRIAPYIFQLHIYDYKTGRLPDFDLSPDDSKGKASH